MDSDTPSCYPLITMIAVTLEIVIKTQNIADRLSFMLFVVIIIITNAKLIETIIPVITLFIKLCSAGKKTHVSPP